MSEISNDSIAKDLPIGLPVGADDSNNDRLKSENRHDVKKQQQHFRNQRGSTGGGFRFQKQQRGKSQRHFSHGSMPKDCEGSTVGSNNYSGQRRHSTDENKGKKIGKLGKSASIGGAGYKSVRGSCGNQREHALMQAAQNGGSGDFEYCSDEFDFDEPFSESDEDSAMVDETRRKRLAKPQLLLPMPRRRIRTLSGTIPPVGYSPVWGGPTMCLNCLEFFDLPSQTAAYVEHLLEKHKIVVTDIELIVDLKRYVEYWRHRFSQQPIDQTFPLVEPSENDLLHGKVDKYYLMSETTPEDRQIRERLALRRLEEVLQCQQREREDHTFRRQCLFCRCHPAGNRSKLIHHLYTIHHLNLGSPDNLVFINEYLDVLDGKMKNTECIYCEKKFEDHQTLTDHMRRRQHREVNPKNHYYDKFYVINYLELGKRWLDVLAEDFEDSTPAFIDSEEEEEEEATWNEWQEDNEDANEINAMCLFCEDTLTNSSSLLEHMKNKHQYDFMRIIADQELDFYDAVKLVNYIRKQSYNLVCFVCGKDDLRPRSALTEHLENDVHVSSKLDKEKWNKEEYLIPTYENDHFLLLIGEIVDIQTDDEKETVFLGDDEKKPNTTIPVIPEDTPNLEDTILKDSELRDQLK